MAPILANLCCLEANLVSNCRKKNSLNENAQEDAQDYSIYKAKKVFADRAIRTTGPTLWNSLDSKLKYCKTAKHFRNEFVNNYD